MGALRICHSARCLPPRFHPRSKAAPASAWRLNAPPSTAFAEAEGFEIVAEFTEVETGKGADALDRRPQLKAALKAAKKAQVRGRGRQARSAVSRDVLSSPA